MVTSGEKVNPTVNNRQPQVAGGTFFRKHGEGNFFGKDQSRSFFGGKIQAKLTVSHPNDPQEKEADDMAEHVMRMPDPAQVSLAGKDEEEKTIHRSHGQKEEEVHAKRADIQPEEMKEEEKVHRKEKEKEEEKIHTKCDACRNDEKKNEHKLHTKPGDVGSGEISRKKISLYHSDVLQQSGRGPPADSIPFEQTLSSSKGGGSALPENTKQFMESRFDADFSGVRIHTGSTAQQLTAGVNAKAFAHGNDIYFNKGQFSPTSAEGGVLIAHELTHTIQQGASKTKVSTKNVVQGKTYGSSPSFSISNKEIHGNVDTIPEETLRKPPKTREQNATANADAQVYKDQSLQTDKASNNNPKTLRDLRKELFKVDCQEIHDETPAARENIQLKTGLSKWHVDAGGHLQKSAGAVHLNNHKKLQRKEETEKKEEEKQVASIQPQIQKKQAEDIQSKYDASVNNKNVTQKSSSAYTAGTAIIDSSLNYTTDGSKSVTSTEQDRGPPAAQMKSIHGEFVIQRSWLGSAWNAVKSAAGDAAAFVEKGLDVAKEWILGKIKAFVQNIPGYNILGLILQHDPITNQAVERSGRNILLAGLQLIPGGSLFQQVLERVNAIDEAGAWIDARIGDLVALVSGIGSRFTQFIDHLSLDDIRNPEGVLNRVADLFKGIFNDVIGFMSRAAGEFLEMIKRIMLRLIVDFVKDKIPRLYPLLRVALGHDPITGEDVARNGHNILYAVLDATDDGREQRKQMEDTGSFDKAAAWIDRGIEVFTKAYGLLRQAFTNLWANVTIDNLASPIETFNRIYADFSAPVNLVKNFLIDVAKEIIRLIKDALLKRLRDYARGTKGYLLVTVIIGKDPFTGEVVPRTVANIIHGFMSLMEGGEEQYKQMEQSGAIARAAQQIEVAVAKLNMTPEYIIGLFIKLWNSFGLKDLAHPIDAFTRIVHEFGEPIGRLIDFVIEIIKIVVHVILEIMNFPFDLINNIITKAMMAFELIKKDPIGFLKNLLRAIKEGFMQFFGNILTHLVNGLKAWFLSEVQAAGIPIPKDFSVMGILKWLLAVLDITMEKIWKKLEERIGKPKVDKIKSMIATVQKVAGVAGDALAFMEDVQKRGFLAVMIDKVKEQLSNIWELVLDAVKSFVMDQIIKKVTAKLLSMLDPTGIMAVINSAIALYKAIQSFIRYLRQMLEIVNSFVEGTLQIAQGATKNAADFLEGALARGIPIVIGFFANQVGLNLSEHLKDALELVREKVDKGLTWVIDKVVIIIEKLVSFGKGAIAQVKDAVSGWFGLKKKVEVSPNETHNLSFNSQSGELIIASTPIAFRTFLATLRIPDHKQTKLSPIKTSIEGQLLEVDNLIGNTTLPEADKTAKIQALLELIGPSVAELIRQTTGTSLRSLDPQYGGLHGGFASAMRVQIVDGRPATNGSQPKSGLTNANWSKLKNRKTTAGSSDTYYIRAHLLNDNLGGPGDDWKNLSVLTQDANNRDWYSSGSHLAIETRAKGPLSEEGKAFIYVVTAAYGRNRNNALLAQIPISSLSASAKADIQGIIEAEEFVPTSFTCTINEIDPSTGKTEAASDHNINVSVPNTIANASLTDYYL